MSSSCAAWLRVCVGAFFTLFAFTVAGFQGILPVLKKAGVYAALCASADDDGAAVPGDEAVHTAEATCHAQEMRLGLMFILSVSLINVSALVVGPVISRVGPRWTCMAGGLLIALGSVIFAVSTDQFQGWLAGYVIMGAGAPFVAFSMFTLPGLVPPERMGAAFSIIVGAFDGSAGVMFILQLLHDHAGYSVRDLFLALAACLVALAAASFWLFPAPCPCCPPEGPGGDDAEEGAEKKEPLVPRDDTWAQVGDLPTDTMLRQWPFAACSLWAACFITAKYFYMENLDQQLSWITGDASKVSTGTQVFSVLLPCAGLFSPVTAAILDKLGAVAALAILGTLQGLVGVLAVVPSYSAQYVTMAVLVFNRFLFFAAAPFVLTKLYGGRGMSVVYGLTLFIGAVVNLSNYLWTYLSVHVLGNNWLPFMLFLNLLACAYGLFFADQVRRWRDAAAAGASPCSEHADVNENVVAK